MSGIAWVGFDMDYTLAIYNQQEMDELSIRATIEKLIARGYPEFIRTRPLFDRVSRARAAHRQALRSHPQDEPLQARHEGLPRPSRARERRAPRSSTTRRRSARRRRATTGSTRSTRSARRRSTRRIVEAMEQRGMSIDYAKTLHRHPREHRRGAPRRDDPRDGRRGLPAVREQGPRARADAPQAPERRQEALRADELALVVHRQDDDVPARRRDERVPALAQLLRRRHRRGDQAGVLPGAPAAHGARRRDASPRRRSRSSAARSTRAATCTTSSARLGVDGDEILYVGDHIYGDILRSKKESAWRTAMIIQELEAEVAGPRVVPRGLRARRAPRGRARSPRGRAALLPDAVQGAVAAHRPRATDRRRTAHAEAEAERVRIKRAIERVRGRLRQLEAELQSSERRIDQRFHPYWGSLLKEENEQSSFGAQVEEYACLYTSRVCELPPLLAAAVLPEPARRDGPRARLRHGVRPARPHQGFTRGLRRRGDPRVRPERDGRARVRALHEARSNHPRRRARHRARARMRPARRRLRGHEGPAGRRHPDRVVPDAARDEAGGARRARSTRSRSRASPSRRPPPTRTR